MNTIENTTPKIPVDSIAMPVKYQRLCAKWSGGQDCMLYAVSSTGGLTTGTNRPRGCDSNEKWYLTIWRMLSRDVYYTHRCAKNEHAYPEGHEDIDELCKFEEWVDEQVDQLEESYGLTDWDVFDN